MLQKEIFDADKFVNKWWYEHKLHHPDKPPIDRADVVEIVEAALTEAFHNLANAITPNLDNSSNS